MNARLTKKTLTLGALLLTSVMLAGPAMSQPAGGRDDAPNSDHMRQRIEHALDSTRQREAALEDLLVMLDSGASADEVRAKARDVLQDAGGPARGERDGGFRRGHGPGTDHEMLDRIDPGLRDRFERMRREHPERAEELWEKAGPRIERLREMREEDPERFQVRVDAMKAMHQAMRAAHAVVDAGAEGAAQEQIDMLRLDFMEKVGVAVDSGIALRAAELEHAEERLEKLREHVAQMHATRDATVQERAEEMLARAARAEVGLEEGRHRERGTRRGPHQRD